MAAGNDADTGLFGPGSVTWRLHAEPILWVAGLRALLLQMLLPQALAGVLQNSNFREDPWGRLVRTARFFGEVVYGTTAMAEAAGARVRRIHSRLSAVDPVTGERFRIDEPQLLRWIHVTAAESFCSTAQRAGLGLGPGEEDRYYGEQLTIAALVGLDPAAVPGTLAEVERYYAMMRPRLSAGAQARATARFLALPPLPWGLGYTPVRPLWIGVAAHAFSLLPPWARRAYGLPGLPTTDLSATLAARAVRLTLRVLPAQVTEGPLYRAAMRRAELVPGGPAGLAQPSGGHPRRVADPDCDLPGGCAQGSSSSWTAGSQPRSTDAHGSWPGHWEPTAQERR